MSDGGFQGGFEGDTPYQPTERYHIQEDDFQGVSTRYTFQDRSIIREYKYDAEPYLKRAAENRALTEGEKWGETRHVGTVPSAVYWDFISKGFQGKELADLCLTYLKSNPDLVTFSKFLKDKAPEKQIYVGAGNG